MRNQTKDILVVGLALFSMFFGAGNVIFPPYLGVGAGSQWMGAFSWYFIADIGFALVALFAMLRLNSDVEGVTRRIGRLPSVLLTSSIVLCIGPLLAIPRTAASTFEMSILPFTGQVSSIVFSAIFFAIIFMLSVKESAVIDIVGKVLTPLLFLGLLVLIIVGVVSPIGAIDPISKFDSVVSNGIISGYQTMDVLAALIFGVILINTVKAKGYSGKQEIMKVVGGAGIVAGIGLLIVYCGLTYLGATVSTMYGLEVNRSTLVIEIVQLLLGKAGLVIFALVVALACITTAIALTSSCGAYFSRLSNNKIHYNVIVAVTCIFSMLASNIGLDAIVAIANPILNIVYPAAITLILLSYFDERIKNDNVFRFATAGALIISVLVVLTTYKINVPFVSSLPLAEFGFAWIVPTIVCGIIGHFIKSTPATQADSIRKKTAGGADN